jgi:hypothetical protein
MKNKIFALAMLLASGSSCFGSGHGPLFGYATPTNSKGEWSFDVGMSGRAGHGGTQLALRGLMGYGFTPHLMLQVSTPIVTANAPLPPTRTMAVDEFEAAIAWRFQHRASAVGTRFESTAFGGLVAPGPQSGAGSFSTLSKKPGVMAGAVTGIASRSHYIWAGGSFTKFFPDSGDRRPDVLAYSLVYGYRPESWRRESDKWDWRLFAELTGERSARFRQGGVIVADSQAHQVFLGPSALGIYKNYAVEFGVQIPLYQQVGPVLEKERARLAVNVSYFLFQGQHGR